MNRGQLVDYLLKEIAEYNEGVISKETFFSHVEECSGRMPSVEDDYNLKEVLYERLPKMRERCEDGSIGAADREVLFWQSLAECESLLLSCIVQCADTEAADDALSVICFIGPEEKWGELSNWFPCRFVVDEIEFSSAGQYLMFKKAEFFKDHEMMHQILLASEPEQIKLLGRKVAGYSDKIWSGVRQVLLLPGLYAKFTQNAQLQSVLLSTGNTILAESSERDCIWGTGLSEERTIQTEPDSWPGMNLLGFSLMMVRNMLCGE